MNSSHFDGTDRVSDHQHNEPRRGLNSLPNTCFIRAKTTGLVSLFIQVVLIIVSATTAMFFFYHVGGYEYTHWNENSTILEPINHNYNQYQLESRAAQKEVEEAQDLLVSTGDRSQDFLDKFILPNSSAETVATAVFLNSFFQPRFIENASFGIEQVPTTTVMIANVEFDWLEVIRISTLVYIAICIVWVISGLLFICTIRCEILDAVIFNTTVLILVVLFQLSHAGLITSLIFLQREMSWRTLSITIGSIVIIFCCAFLGGVCIALDCGWVRYIDHMHGRKKCSLLAIICCCCQKKRTPRNYEANNGATLQNDIPLDNDIPLERFDAF